jgi:hypothetical protein
MNKIKILLYGIGFGTLAANSIVLYITWLVAFFRGGTVVISINSYNEMWVEFFFIPITLIIAFWVLFKVIKDVKIK